MRRCSSWQRVMSRSRRVWFPGGSRCVSRAGLSPMSHKISPVLGRWTLTVGDIGDYWSIHWRLPSQTYLCFQAPFDVAQLMPDSFNSVASLVQFRFIAALFNLGWLDRILYPLPQMTSHWTHGVGLLTASDFDRDIRPRPCISCFLVSFRWLCAYWSDWSGQDFKIACHCKRHSETEPRLRHLGSDRTSFARKWHGGYGSLPDYPSAHAPYVTRSAWYVAAQGPKRFRSSACSRMPAPCCLMCVESQVVVVLKRKSFTTFKWRQWRLSSKKMWRYAWDGMGPAALLSRMTKIENKPRVSAQSTVAWHNHTHLLRNILAN